MTNAGARPGDLLVLTKPLGTGVIATAIKLGKASPDVIAAATASMAHLNRDAADVARETRRAGDSPTSPGSVCWAI